MLHIATIIHGNEFAILMPIADRWDLEFFLYGGFNRDNGTKKAKAVYDFEKMFPKFVGHSRHSSVLYEMFALAHALDWLHNRLDVKGWPKLRCAHTDFKPSNILICSDEDERFPAGRWMITDFGISAFGSGTGENEDNQDDKQHLADARDLKTVYDFGVELTSKNDTLRVARTQEGTYQAPESRHSGMTHFVGRRSDIWSFGCVLLEVIIFALGDVALLDKFRNQRAHGHQLDCFYTVNEVEQPKSPGQGRRFEQNLQVKDEVQQCLTSLPQQFSAESDWLRSCTDLITSTLEIEAQQRPGAERLKEVMQEVADRTSDQITNAPLPANDQLRGRTNSRVDSPDVNQRSTLHETSGVIAERITPSPNSYEYSEQASTHLDAESAEIQSTPTPSITHILKEHTTPRHRTPWPPSDQSTSPLTRHSTSPFSDWTQSEINSGSRPRTIGSIDVDSPPVTGVGRRFSLGSPIRQYPIPRREKVLGVCVAPDAERVAFLFARHVRTFSIDGSVGPSLELDSRAEWRQVCISGHCVAAYGIKDKRKQVSGTLSPYLLVSIPRKDQS